MTTVPSELWLSGHSKTASSKCKEDGCDFFLLLLPFMSLVRGLLFFPFFLRRRYQRTDGTWQGQIGATGVLITIIFPGKRGGWVAGYFGFLGLISPPRVYDYQEGGLSLFWLRFFEKKSGGLFFGLGGVVGLKCLRRGPSTWDVPVRG